MGSCVRVAMSARLCILLLTKLLALLSGDVSAVARRARLALLLVAPCASFALAERARLGVLAAPRLARLKSFVALVGGLAHALGMVALARLATLALAQGLRQARGTTGERGWM